MVVIAKDCLTTQGVLPVKTTDINDTIEANKVVADLLSDRFRLVFKRCYLLGVLTLCPIFYNLLISKYNVDSEKLDEFVNNPQSMFSIHFNNYITSAIKDANMLVAQAIMAWVETGGCTAATVEGWRASRRARNNKSIVKK
jgi:hypothetical protein